MTFKKICKIKPEGHFRYSVPTKLKSNFESEDICLKDNQIFIKERIVEIKSFDSKVSFEIFNITPKFSLLCFDADTHFLIDVDDKIKKVSGRPTYITENGYFSVVYGKDPRYSEIFVYYHNLIDDTTLKKLFRIERNKGYFFMDSHIVYKVKNKIIKNVFQYNIHVYGDEKYIFKDFQTKNIDFPDIQEYLYTFDIESDKTGQVIINFKDCIKTLDISRLLVLKSSFINEQINSEDRLYLDVEYSSFEYKTFEFLAYIKSYLLTLFFNQQVKSFLSDKIFNISHRYDIIPFRPQFKERFEDFITKI